jgi:hypothetical protein
MKSATEEENAMTVCELLKMVGLGRITPLTAFNCDGNRNFPRGFDFDDF